MKRESMREKTTACVMVSGDIGRSPRMQYHAIALQQLFGEQVHIIGHKQTPCMTELNKLVTNGDVLLKNVYSSFRVIELCRMMYAICVNVRPNLILVQNTPAIPTILCIVLLYPFLWIRRTRVVIDWHNLSFTIAERKNKSRLAISALYWVERMCAYLYEYHIGVSNAMILWFHLTWNTRVVHIPDAPFTYARPTSEDNASRTLTHYLPKLNLETTDRPLVCFTSTSWTEDERFDILWRALELFDKRFNDCNIHLYMIITGKGPLRAVYERKLDFEPFDHIQVVMLFLDHYEYRNLIGCADVGISLHDSTSGLDLPMKILDMFGAGLPVVAKNYTCIGELVNSENGVVFDTPEQLFHILYTTPLERWKCLKHTMPSYTTFLNSWHAHCANMMIA